MRIIFFNTYTGYLKQKIFTFLDQEKETTDIFCFQEVSVSLQPEIQELLSVFCSVFEEGFLLSDVNEIAGQSIFFNNRINLITKEKVLLHELKIKDIGFLLKARFDYGGKQFLLGNVHGTAQPSNKLDSETRIEQSKIILNSFNEVGVPKIIGGDFNLLRNTESIKMFEKEEYVNLIKAFDIKATRNNVAWNRFKDDIGYVKQLDSDYCFVSKDVKVNDFQVPNIEASDHEPLILDFEI